ncbi:MAG TPA: FliM/FliN family flagellar motor switch protein [Dongiaceae bacterium]|nr:FliM/FliN family flagellar motor switch protein [Dongiaceae bacterium]
MHKILTQSEIDALFHAAQKTPATRSQKKQVSPCDLGRTSQLGAERIRVVTSLHESLARRLSDSLGASLRVAMEIVLVSAEQFTYGEFLARVPDLTYIASLRVMPIDANAVLQTDLTLVFPMVDLILGGSGGDVVEARELTEIETQIFESVVRVIARDLQTTWAPVLPLDIQFDQRHLQAQAQSLMLTQEKILTLNFEVRLPEVRGPLSIAFPAVVANALLRKLSVKWSYSERTPSRDMRRRLRERLLDSRFSADLSLPLCPLTIRELLAIQPGKVLILPKRATEPIYFNVAGVPYFSAFPVREGSQRGARVKERIQPHLQNGKEHS